ncbi:MAG: hypothetical protein ACK5H2_10460 [Beutenbergiaceae bacterium]
MARRRPNTDLPRRVWWWWLGAAVAGIGLAYWSRNLILGLAFGLSAAIVILGIGARAGRNRMR